jgi:membrane protease YdiL (CAAX protease family)
MTGEDLQSSLFQKFLLLLFLLSIPFWLFGGNKLPLPINLPASALMFINPFVAAMILSYRWSGWNGVRELFKKTFDYQKISNRVWYLPTLLLMPVIMTLSYAIMRLAGLPLPEPVIPWAMVPVFFLIFLISAISEELGWMGLAVEPVQKRWGVLGAGLILGTVWAVWHTIPFLQTGNTANWIVWHSLTTVALRIIIVWLFNNMRSSVFSAILFHGMINVSEFLFPNYGSHYNPLVTGLVTWLVVAIILLIWKPETLSRFRHTKHEHPL